MAIGSLRWHPFPSACGRTPPTFPKASPKTLRWPISAGFTAPRSALSSWLIGGLLLAGLCGILRLASHPPLPCLDPSDLAYYNADDGDSDAQHVQVDGHVVGYPLRKDGRQQLDVETTTILLDDKPALVTGRVRLQTSSRHPPSATAKRCARPAN